MKVSEIQTAIRNGLTTTDEIAAHFDRSTGHTQKRLKSLVDDGVLARERDGHGYVYSVPAEPTAETEPRSEPQPTDASALDRMPVSRDYDFRDYRVEQPAEFIASDDKLAELNAEVTHRETFGESVRVLIDGHTGTGKTTLVQNVAAMNDAAFFSVQMTDSTTEGDLFGAPVLAGDSSVWVDGPVTKALMASAPVERQLANGWAADEDDAHEGVAVLLVDETNRAKAKTLNALFSALDHRAEAVLTGGRGGERINGDELDLVVMATINQGPEYHGTSRMDLAGKSRFTSRFTTEWLATDPTDDASIDREAELLARRKGLDAEVARTVVRTTAEVRRRSADATNTTVRFGVPTRAVLALAGKAQAFAEADLDHPLMRVAERTVVGPYYSDPGDEEAADEVRGIYEDRVGNLSSLDGETIASETASEVVRCDSCAYRAPKPDAEAEGVMATMECPDCSGTVTLQKRTRGEEASSGSDVGELFG